MGRKRITALTLVLLVTLMFGLFAAPVSSAPALPDTKMNREVAPTTTKMDREVVEEIEQLELEDTVTVWIDIDEVSPERIRAIEALGAEVKVKEGLVFADVPLGSVAEIAELSFVEHVALEREEYSYSPAEVRENWVEVGRGRDYLLYQNTLTGEHKQHIYSGPIHTWSGTEWVSYIFTIAPDYYQIQHPLASVRFYPYYTVLYDEEFSDVRIYDERWAIEYWHVNRWKDAGFWDATLSYEVISEDEIHLIRTGQTSIGVCKQTHVFRKGSPLKIKIELTATQDVKVRFVWKPSGITAAREVKAQSMRKRDKAWIDSHMTFFDADNNSRACLAWFAEIEAVDNISASYESHAQGRKATITFGDFNLLVGEVALLDPTVNIGPNNDTFVGEFDPDLNHGSDQDLYIWDVGFPAYRLWTYLGFDLSSVPLGASVTDAKLALYCNYFSAGFTSAASDAVDLYETTSFNESTLTWNNKPEFADFLNNVVSFNTDTWYEWRSDTLKNYVESRAGASAWFGLRGNKDGDGYISGPEQIDYSSIWTFNSKEATNNHPYLEVTYSTKVKIYPTDDADVYERYPNNNYGSDTSIYVQPYDSRRNRGFLKFDLGGIPEGVIIVEAKLYANVWKKKYGDFATDIYTVGDDSWNEYTITWNNQPAYGDFLDWEWINGTGWYVWDVTSFVAEEFAGDKIVGLSLRGADPETQGGLAMFDSKEWYRNHPYLEVVYTSYPEMAEKYFPYLWFHEDEDYFPCSFYFDDDADLNNNHSNYGEQDLPPETPGYAYIEIVESGNLLGIDYWFYYARNSDHDHDWEGALVVFEKSGLSTPIRVTFRQHGGKEQVPWGEVEISAGTHPTLYVADGKHASYPEPVSGFWPWDDDASRDNLWTPQDFAGHIMWKNNNYEERTVIYGINQPEPDGGDWPFTGFGGADPPPWNPERPVKW